MKKFLSLLLALSLLLTQLASANNLLFQNWRGTVQNDSSKNPYSYTVIDPTGTQPSQTFYFSSDAGIVSDLAKLSFYEYILGNFNSADLPIDPMFACLEGDSIASNHDNNFNVTGYSKTDGVATLTVDTSPVGIIAANGIIYVAGGSALPAEYKGYQYATGVTATTVTFAASAGTTSGTIATGYAKIHDVSGAGGIGAGKGPRGIFNWVQIFSNNSFLMPASYNFGVSGDTYADAGHGGVYGIEDRIADNLAQVSPACRFVIFLAGTNDMNRVAGGTETFAAAQNAAVASWNYARSQGAIPIVHAILAADENAGLVAAGFNKQAARWNKWLDDYARQYRNIVIVNGTGRFNDPASTTGAARANFSVDKLHPNSMGAMEAALDEVPVFNGIGRQTSAKAQSQLDAYVAGTNPSGEILNSKTAGLGMFIAADGAATTITATSFGAAQNVGGWLFYRDSTGTGTITVQRVARTDTYADTGETVPGNELVITFSGTAASSSLSIDMPSAAWFTTSVSPGDNLFAESQWAWTGLTAITALSQPDIGLTINDQTAGQFVLHGLYRSEVAYPSAFGGISRTQSFTVKGALNSIRATGYVQAPVGTSAVLRVRYIAVRKNETPLPW